MAGAADVPYPFDVVINGEGYRLLDSVQTHPFGTHRANYGLSPSFVPRTNISGDYGDNFQDFWMTLSQRDWSLGEQQRHFRGGDDESVRRYFQGSKVDIRVPGQVTIRHELRTVAPTGTPLGMGVRGGSSAGQNFLYVTSTNLYEVSPEGTVTDRGAHGGSYSGVGLRQAILSDWSGDVYLAHDTGVRKWTGSAFSSFSSQRAERLAYLNNTLYGLDKGTNTLYRYDTAGVASSVYQWKAVDGGNLANWSNLWRVLPYGGDLLILQPFGPNGPELHIYDGTGVATVLQLSRDMVAYDMCVAMGIVFISVLLLRPRSAGSNYEFKPAILYWVNGQQGVVWEGEDYTGNAATPDAGTFTSVVPFDQGIVWHDSGRGSSGPLLYYDIANGGFHSLAVGSSAAIGTEMVSNTVSFMTNQATRIFPDGTNLAVSAFVITSLFDGDNSLTKRFKSVRIDGEKNGGTFDLAYQVDTLDGSWTSIQTETEPGTEYAIPGTITARSIAVRVTLNRASATAGPTLRRIYIRAAPILDSFKRREYLLDLSGRDGESMIVLRDMKRHVKDGLEMAVALNDAADATSPITIIDRFGSFTGIIDTEGYDIVEIRPEEFAARVRVREV